MFPDEFHRPKLEHAEEWEGDAKLGKNLRTVHMAKAKVILVCSESTSNTASETGMAMHPLKTKT